jgi:Mn-dependent DtxR family transcriptional regulator
MKNYWEIRERHVDVKYCRANLSKDLANKLDVTRIFLAEYLKTLEKQGYVKFKRTGSVKVCWGGRRE